MSRSEVGCLVPLGHNLEQVHSAPSIPIWEGPNAIGRDNILPVPDKRLSRKHLSLFASIDGSLHAVVEGTNPVVFSSRGKRQKIYAGSKADIGYGDIIELLPGQHFFKYVAVGGDCTGMKHLNENETHTVVEGCAEKRMKINSETEDFQERPKLIHQHSQTVMEKKSLASERYLMGKGSRFYHSSSTECLEAIRYFNVKNDTLPMTFRLMRVQGLPEWANTSCVSIADVIQGDVHVAILSNYMVDIDWLLSACPALREVSHVLVIHGESDGALDLMKRKKPPSWILHKPPLPISYGTHHSKAMLLVHPWGVRIIVHTANLIFVDWNNKSQGLWMQDFPWKDQNSSYKICGFEGDLIDYLSALKLPNFTVGLPDRGNCVINASFFKKFDYSNSVVRLIGSVPGYHMGSNLKRWGHMKLRTLLRESIFDVEFVRSPLVYQFSSLGSLDEKWMAELETSMSSGLSADKRPLGLGQPLIIWPTVEDVRCSLEGYAAGNAIPSPQKNVEKEFLKKYWSRWRASHTGRCRAMPHIKTYVRYSSQNIAWFLLTSANLSKAAWGALQKNDSQLMIRSYELGVLFLPSSSDENSHGLSYESGSRESAIPGIRTRKLATLKWEGNSGIDSSIEVVRLPVPYELPPPPYSSQDVPWSWDKRCYKKDVYGEVWPRQVQLYSQD